jgi:hypothetical protein
VPECLSVHLSVIATEIGVQDQSGIVHAFSALGVGRQEPQSGHLLSDLGVASSVLDLACREVLQEMAILEAVCEVSVQDSIPHAVVEDSVSHAAAAADDVEDSVLHAVVEDSASHVVVEDSAPHVVDVEDSIPQAVAGDSVHADAVFPSGSSDVAVSFGSRAELAAANRASRVGSGDVVVAFKLPVA